MFSIFKEKNDFQFRILYSAKPPLKCKRRIDIFRNTRSQKKSPPRSSSPEFYTRTKGKQGVQETKDWNTGERWKEEPGQQHLSRIFSQREWTRRMGEVTAESLRHGCPPWRSAPYSQGVWEWTSERYTEKEQQQNWAASKKKKKKELLTPEKTNH